MTIYNSCPNGRRREGSPCIFCADGSYCCHQEYSPDTRRYENVWYLRCEKSGGNIPDPEKRPLFERVDNVKVRGRELQFLEGGMVLKSVMLPVTVMQGEDAATDEELKEMFNEVFEPREQY